MLGWRGNFGRFDNLLSSPIMELQIMEIENFSAGVSIYYFSNKNTGEFTYLAGSTILWLRQEWEYYRIPVDLKFNLDIGPVIFISGFEVSYTKLSIDAKSNYKMNDSYPKSFVSDDVGLFVGIGRIFKKFKFEFYYNYRRNDQFSNEDGYLYYNDGMSYIYIGPDNHHNPTAILDHSGIGIIIFYSLFD